MGTRLVGNIKIVDVAPVIGRRFRGSPLLEKTVYGRLPSGTVRPKSKKVITLMANTDSKANGINGPVLADKLQTIL